MTAFDEYERHQWAGRAAAYEESFAKLCAHTVPALLAAVGVGMGTSRGAGDGAAVRLLDAGTGPGTVAELACAAGAAVSAVDAEPSMVALARRRAPTAHLCLGVLPRLSPLAYGCYDIERAPTEPASTSADDAGRRLRTALETSAKSFGTTSKLDAVVAPADPVHPAVRLLTHRYSRVFTLNSPPNALLDAAECTSLSRCSTRARCTAVSSSRRCA